MLYCANFYGRCFIRVYEDKMPVIKVCTVQHYFIIILKQRGLISKILYLTKLMTTFPSLLLRLNINLLGLIPSATPNVKQKTNYIKLLSRSKPLSLN